MQEKNNTRTGEIKLNLSFGAKSLTLTFYHISLTFFLNTAK